MNKLKKAFKNPKTALIWLWWKSSRFIVSDRLYLKVFYKLNMGEKLDIKNPKTFNQKTQWLKLHNREERYTQMVDKYGVREIIKKEIGEEYLIPLLGVWNEFDDINFDKLPNQFVLKTTHDSGTTLICKDKSTWDINLARKKINSALRKNYFYFGREYPYKNVKPRIVCEHYVVDESGTELKDYKFFCFDGVPKLFFVASNRFIDVKFAYYDMELNRLHLNTGKYSLSNETITKIESFDTMVELAKKFSKGIPFVRVDLYNINGKVYFGEFTFHHDGGVVPFYPQEWDKKLGDLIRLPFE
jgi:hypothetical protein